MKTLKTYFFDGESVQETTGPDDSRYLKRTNVYAYAYSYDEAVHKLYTRLEDQCDAHRRDLNKRADQKLALRKLRDSHQCTGCGKCTDEEPRVDPLKWIQGHIVGQTRLCPDCYEALTSQAQLLADGLE